MIVTISIKIVSTVEKLLDFKFVLFRVADLVINNSCAINNNLMVKRGVMDIDLLRISQEIVYLVNIDAITSI